eukprot:scaffold1220_cov259-Pinguiococcus_pyrenoidosus.AAC.35
MSGWAVFFLLSFSVRASQELDARGVEHLHVFSVDNALVKPADPKFIGFCISRNADCGNEVVWKRDADEKVSFLRLSVERMPGRD